MADYQARIDDFAAKNIKVMTLSTDSLEEANKMIERRKITYPMAWGVNGRDFAATTGAFFDEAKGFLHATGFILRPDGTIDDAVYSTGPIGRLTAGDALTLIDHRMKNPG